MENYIFKTFMISIEQSAIADTQSCPTCPTILKQSANLLVQPSLLKV
jgi:hypothetical protein